MKAKLLLSISFCLSLLFVNTVEANIDNIVDPVGTYDFIVTDIPDMEDVKGTMTVSKSGNGIKVNFSSSAGDIDLVDAKLDGDKLTGTIEAQGILLKLRGSFTADGFKGQFDTEFGALSFTASKK